MTVMQEIITVAAAVSATVLTRFLPFWIFNKQEKTPGLITDLGHFLPAAIMAILVVYCYKDADFTGPSHGLPELIAGALVIIIHLWRRSMFLSLIVGTGAYILLINYLF